MPEKSNVARRRFVKSVSSLALVGTLAGCSSDGGDGGDGNGGDGNGGDGNRGDGDGGGSGNSDVDNYLSETSNYDGIEDFTGESEVTVDVGVEANDGAFGFGPAAIRIDSGTTVIWEWTGEGGTHNVAHDGGDFESEMTDEAGFTFEQQFDEAGTYLYECTPHASIGMKGAVVVE